MTVREINRQLKAGAALYVYRASTGERYPIQKARTQQGRMQVQTRWGTWQGVGGEYQVIKTVKEQKCTTYF